MMIVIIIFFFQAEDGIRDLVRSRGLGDVYKRQGKYFGFTSYRLDIYSDSVFQNWRRPDNHSSLHFWRMARTCLYKKLHRTWYVYWASWALPRIALFQCYWRERGPSKPGRLYYLRFVCTRWTPVSYTHLRAHETVLDLVCRLLLEKKTNTYEFVRHRHSYAHDTRTISPHIT